LSDVLSLAADILPRRDCRDCGNRRCRFPVLDKLGWKNGVTAVWHRRPCHDSHGLAGANVMEERTAWKGVADYDQGQTVIRCRALCRFGDKRIPIHCCAIEAGDIHVACNGFG
jgi:hypothetical protein